MADKAKHEQDANGNVLLPDASDPDRRILLAAGDEPSLATLKYLGVDVEKL